MSINLITDGWLYPIITKPQLRAPNGTEGAIDDYPLVPCSAIGLPSDTPPSVPDQAAAAGPSVPVAPCGATGSDPTLDPPEVPKGAEGSEDLGQEAPAPPKCPEGHET